MKNLNLFRLILKLKAPLLVGYTAPDHNLFKTLEYLPSSTLRGGIATQLLYDECKFLNNATKFGKCEKCEDKNNCKFYQFFYIDIFSITNGLFLNNKGEKKCCEDPDLVPAHPLIKQCKRCKPFYEKYINYVKKWQSEEEPYLRSDCPNPECKRKTTMEPIEKNYCKNCFHVKSTPETGITTSTGINYAKNSSLTGYLFNYSYIEQDSVFESYLLCENKDILDSLKFIRIGRSKSRGFGKISLKTEKLEIDKKIKKNEVIIDNMFRNKSNIIIAAKTHIFNLEIPEINPNLICNPIIDLNSALEFVSNSLDLNLSNIGNIFKFKASMGDLQTFGGWSYKTEQPKSHITAANPGSLYKFQINGTINEKIIEALAYLEFVGLNKYSRLGYNLIYYPGSEEIKNDE